MSIVSKKISLGTKKGASEPLVLGETLKKRLEELIDCLVGHTHPTGVGPSGPPAPDIPKMMEIRLKLPLMLSNQNTTD